MKYVIPIVSLAAILVLAGAGCAQPVAPAGGDVSGSTTTPVAANAVTIKGYAFTPKTLAVKKGTTVTWTSEDIAKHTVTGKNGGPASALLAQGESYSYTFDTVGTFEYFCEPHPYMTASVEVTE